jgi:hypothetical protein
MSHIRDLFGEEAQNVSFPRITWGDYDEIVGCIDAKVGNSLLRVTGKVFEDATIKFVSVVQKESLFITAFITRIVGTEAHFILAFDDLEATVAIRNKVLETIAGRARLHRSLRIEDGNLVGTVTIPRPINVFFVPERSAKDESGPWPDTSEEELRAFHRR